MNRDCVVYSKCEWYNLSGSIKDRVAYRMIANAFLSNKLLKEQEIVEVTSGNMGLSLAAVGKHFGHKVTIFMPKNMSSERIKLLELLGANLILVEDFNEAFKISEEYAREHNAFLTKQFENKSNVAAHYYGTAEEICKFIDENSIDDKIFGFASGVGSGGTLTGVGTRLKEKYSAVITAIDPYSTLLLTNGVPKGNHKIQGLNSNDVPKNYNSKLVDCIIEVTDEDAIAMTQKLNKAGYPVGISGGANFLGAVLSKEHISFTVFPDDNKKYISTDLSKPIHTLLVDAIHIIRQ
ncbi:MAG: cysteine synthase family protein [Bacilli bacterium]